MSIFERVIAGLSGFVAIIVATCILCAVLAFVASFITALVALAGFLVCLIVALGGVGLGVFALIASFDKDTKLSFKIQRLQGE